MAKLSTEIDLARAEGKQELDTAIDDPFAEMLMTGPEGGQMTMAKAVKRRDENIATIDRLQKAFYDKALEDPQAAQQMMDETNVALLALNAQVQDVNEEILRLLGPKGKYYLAEQKLSEVAARFGPRRVTGAQISDKATPVKKTEAEEQGNLPPLPEGAIPEPPPMPTEKKKVN